MAVPTEKLELIKAKYEIFKNTERYQEISERRKFIDEIAKPIFIQLFKKDSITIDDLTNLNQIFKENCTGDTFEVKLLELHFEKDFTEKIITVFKDLNLRGYTGAPRAKLILDKENKELHLKLIFKLLKDVYKASSEDEIRAIVQTFDQNEVSFVKFGTYSPWLHYLHPDICPIVNKPPINFLKNLGFKINSYLDAWDKLKEINEYIGAPKDFGYLDSFFYWANTEPIPPIIPPPKTQFKDNNLLLKKKQIIMYGPPGTGKTYITKEKAVEVIGMEISKAPSQVAINQKYEELRNSGQIEFITFHPSYSYEEFVEGITVNVTTSEEDASGLKYELKQGIFKQMVIRALAGALDSKSKAKDGTDSEISLKKLLIKYKNETKNIVSNMNNPDEKLKAIEAWWVDKPRFVLIIDEINRGDISKIFGELITLLEADKRLGMENELMVKLPYSQEDFGVPPNLYIVGTMNTADKSIALIDVALRRRFGFIEKSPNFKMFEEYVEKKKDYFKEKDVYEGLKDSIKAIEYINKHICADPSVGRDKQIGHSFLYKVQNKTDLHLVWENELLPLLEEYYYGQYFRIQELLFGDGHKGDWITPNEGVKGFENYDDLMNFLNAVKRND